MTRGEQDNGSTVQVKVQQIAHQKSASLSVKDATSLPESLHELVSTPISSSELLEMESSPTSSTQECEKANNLAR